jgi:hypothetical protein
MEAVSSGADTMVRKTRWNDSPSLHWVGVGTAAIMLVLYIQEMLGPDKRPITAYVLFAWAAMFGLWLTKAIHATWFKRGKMD